MWTLILITFLASGASSGGVGTTTSFLDFASEAKCRAAANALTEMTGKSVKKRLAKTSPTLA